MSFEKLLGCLAKSGAIKVLKALERGEKRLKDIVGETGLDKSTVWRRLEEFERELRVVEVEYNRDLKVPIYKITPIGLQVLGKIKEMEEIWGEGLAEGKDR